MMVSICMIFSVCLMPSEVAKISSLDLRWIACVVFSSRLSGWNVSSHDIELMYKNQKMLGNSAPKENQIPGFFYHCLAGSSCFGIEATENPTLDLSALEKGCIVLLHTPRRSVAPAVYLRLTGNQVELSMVLPDDDTVRMTVDSFKRVWTGNAFRLTAQNRVIMPISIMVLLGFGAAFLLVAAAWPPIRKNIHVIVTVLLLPIMGCTDSSLDDFNSGMNSQQIEFERPTLDLGHFNFEDSKDTSADVNFVVTQPIFVRNAGTSCACVDIGQLTSKIGSTLEPGPYSCKLPISLHLQAGLLHRTVAIEYVKSNERSEHPKQSYTSTFVIQYEVTQPPNIVSSDVTLEYLQGERVARGVVEFERLVNVVTPPLKLDPCRMPVTAITIGDISVHPPMNQRTNLPVMEVVTVPIELELDGTLVQNRCFIVAWEGTKQVFEITWNVIERHPLLFTSTSSFVGISKPGSRWHAKFRFSGRELPQSSIESLSGDLDSLTVGKYTRDAFVVSGMMPNTKGRFEETISVVFKGNQNLPPAILTISGVVQE